MKIKNLLKIMFVVIMIFLFNVSVFAFENNTGIIQQYGEELNYNGKLKFHLKFYDIGETEPVVFCTQFSRTTPAGKDKTCSLSNSWPKSVSTGVASIIEKVGLVTSAATDIDLKKYYYGEIAINEFLCNSGVDTEYTCIHEREDINVTTPQELLGDYYSWYTEAISIRDSYNQASLTFSESKLTFNKEEDNYVSNKFYVIQKSFDGTDIRINLRSSVGELKKDGNSYYVVVPVASVQPGSSIDVSIAADVSKTVSVAQNYYCGDDYQDITPNIIGEDKLSKNASISGTLTREIVKGSLEITKLDKDTEKVMSGVEFSLYLGNSCSGEVLKTSTTDANGKAIFDELELGTYSYQEIETISGYVSNSKCEVIQITAEQLNIEKEVTNQKNKIQIVKISFEDNRPLSGAKLHLEDNEGNIIESWTTDGEPYVFAGLGVGTYYVVEDSAPEGYVLNKTKREIVIKEDTDELKIEISNKLITVEISKISAVDKKELPGATLQILDENKTEISCVKSIDDTKSELIDKCTWISGDKSTKIVGLMPGTYYLVEKIAPEGYVLSEEAVKFEIKEDGTVDPVVMENQLEVKVPDTLSSRSTLLIAISMFDIALGIGILTYVKKNKIEE